VAPPCSPWSKPDQKVCDDFCNYRCSFYNPSHGDTGRPKNITIHRLTPRNVTGLINKNTGDARGDVAFVLSRKNATQFCLHHPMALSCHTDIESADLYGTFIVEVDGQWGPYQMCNPADNWDTRDFRCGLECLRPTHAAGCPRVPQHGVPHNGTSSSGGFNCWCDRTYRSVGRERSPFGRGSQNYFPKEWTPQCKTGDFWVATLPGRCVTGIPYKRLQGWSEASALALACKECSGEEKCSGWTLGADGKSAWLFQGRPWYRPCPEGQRRYSAFKWINPNPWMRNAWLDVGDIGGHWYSMTDDGGECRSGVPVGTDGCTWRVVETRSYKNATCVDTHADAAVEEYGKVCFDSCPRPLNRNTDCYLDCYRNVLVGDASLNITKPPASLVVDPWLRALMEDDPEKGGCPPEEPSAGPLHSDMTQAALLV